MRKLIGIIALLAVAALNCYGFPTNTESASVDINGITGNWDSFRWKWIGQNDQRVELSFYADNTGDTVSVAGYNVNARVSKDKTTYIDIPYTSTSVSGATTNITTNITIAANAISFSVARTNIPPDSNYKMEVWAYDGATTNIARTLAQGQIAVSYSLYDDTNVYPFPVTPTNLANYLTVGAAFATYLPRAEGYTNFTMVESTSNYVDFTSPTLIIGLNTNSQDGDITSVTVDGGFLSGGTNTGDAVITLTTNAIDAVFATDIELSTATNANYISLTNFATAADIVATNLAVSNANAYTDLATGSVDLASVMAVGNEASTNLDMSGFFIGDTEGEGIYVSSNNGAVAINTKTIPTLPTFGNSALLTVQADGARHPSVIIKDGTTTSKTKSLAFWDTGTTNIWSIEQEAGAPFSLEFWYYRGATATWEQLLSFNTNGNVEASTNFVVGGDTTLADLTAQDATFTGNITITSNILANGHIYGDGDTIITGIEDIYADDGIFSNSLQVGATDVVLESRKMLEGAGITIGDPWLTNDVTFSLDLPYTDARYLRAGTNVFRELIVADDTETGIDLVHNGSFTNGIDGWVATNFIWNAALSNITVLSGNAGFLVPSNAISITTGYMYTVSYEVDVNDSYEIITLRLGGYTNVFRRTADTGDITYTNTLTVPAFNQSGFSLTATALSNNITLDNITIERITKGNLWADAIYADNMYVVQTPVDALDVANKAYVDSVAGTGAFATNYAGANVQIAWTGNVSYISADAETDPIWGGVSNLYGGISNRTLRTDANKISVNWNQYQLRDSADLESVNWSTRFLKTKYGQESLDWDSRTVTSSNGANVFNWENNTFATVPTVDGNSFLTNAPSGSGTTNANAIAANFTPTNYTAAAGDVSSHLQGIDGEIAVLVGDDIAISNTAEAAQTSADAANTTNGAQATAIAENLSTNAIQDTAITANLSTNALQDISIDANLSTNAIQDTAIAANLATNGTQDVTIADHAASLAAHTNLIDAVEAAAQAAILTNGLQDTSIAAAISTNALQDISIAANLASNNAQQVEIDGLGGTAVIVIARNNVTQYANGGEFYKVVMVEEVDTASAFADSTFTAPSTGYYLINAQVNGRVGVGVQNTIRIWLNINGDHKNPANQGAVFDEGIAIAYCSMSINAVVYLTAGDTVYIDMTAGGPVGIWELPVWTNAGDTSIYSTFTINKL